MQEMLSKTNIQLLREKILIFLSDRGVQVDHPGVRRLLGRAGAKVGQESVYLPRDLVEAALAHAPKTFSLAATRLNADLPLPRPEGGFYLCTGTGARGIIDPLNGIYRPLVREDIAQWGRLADALDIDMCAFPTPTDVPAETVDVHALRTLLESCGSHIWIQPHTQETLPYLLQLAAVRTGGKEQLAKRPIVSIIACALTPFRFKKMDLEVVLQACGSGIPLHLSSLPVLGGTAPVTPGGAVLVAGIEVVALAVMTQIIRPGHPVIGLGTALEMDMRSGRAFKAGPGAMLTNSLCARLLGEGFGLPTHTAGMTTDSYATEGQAAIEHSLYTLMVGSKVDILGRAGELEAAKTISPLQLIIDAEIAQIANRLARSGLDPLSLAWEEILATKPGGHFLDNQHTLKHCREAFEPRVFNRLTREQWQSDGQPSLLERAARRYKELMGRTQAETQTLDLPSGTISDMDRIVAEADRRLIRRS